jgi:hypothetical protein
MDPLIRLKVEGLAGMDVRSCADQMVALARLLNVVIECQFNEIQLIAYPQHISGGALADAYFEAAGGKPSSPGMIRMAFSDGKHAP